MNALDREFIEKLMHDFHFDGDVTRLCEGCISDAGVDALDITVDMLLSCWSGNKELDWGKLSFFSGELLACYCANKKE